MTSDQERTPRRRAGIVEQWRAHGTYPSPERQCRRAGMIFGALLVAAALVLTGRIVGHLALELWHWSSWG